MIRMRLLVQRGGKRQLREDWVRTINEQRGMGEEDEHQDELENEKMEMARVD
jgi:hypothetical protein